MHLAILFTHIGNYHIARLRAAYQLCRAHGWRFTALQVTDQTKQHPWGNIPESIEFSVVTLMPATGQWSETERHPESPLAATLLRKALEQIGPDVLAIPGWGFPVSRAALTWCRKHNVASILMSESKWDDEKRYWWKERLKSWLYVRHFDTALVGGSHHADYLKRLGLPRQNIFEGYDAVDNAYFVSQAAIARRDGPKTRERQPLIPQRPYFLSVTRLIERKNVGRLLQAYADYYGKFGSEAWDLVICGSGSEAKRLKQQAQRLDLTEKLHFPGFLPYQAISDWYGLANAFIHPALHEQWGLVVNEACAAGLPILCSKTIGAQIALVRDGQNGFLFDPLDKDDIAQKLISIHCLNEQQRVEWGAKSLELVSHYGPDKFAAGILGCLKVIRCHTFADYVPEDLPISDSIN